MSWLELEAPAASEHDPYYSRYIERVEGNQVSLILRQQRAEILEILNGLSEEQAGFRYAPEKWSIKEVIGHLIDTERVFVYRALCCARGEKQPQPGFEQDDYVAEGRFDQRSVASLVAEYESVRGATLAFFEGLDPADFECTGVANDATISVRALVFILAGHESHHLSILRERYLDEL